jgi:hypothetical protein
MNFRDENIGKKYSKIVRISGTSALVHGSESCTTEASLNESAVSGDEILTDSLTLHKARSY